MPSRARFGAFISTARYTTREPNYCEARGPFPEGTSCVSRILSCKFSRYGVLFSYESAENPFIALAAEGKSDDLTVSFGRTSDVRFRLDVPGTYYYWGTTTNSPPRKTL